MIFYAGGCPRDEMIEVMLPILKEHRIALLTFGKPNMFDVGKIEVIWDMSVSGTTDKEIKSILKVPERFKYYPVNNRAITPIHNLDIFTPQARARWNKIEKENQARILANVWCGNCRRSVHMIVDSGKMENKVLVLRGRCKNCGGPVVRLIESDD